jgi:hypothetical protein
MPETKTRETDADVGAFISAVDSVQKRQDSATLVEIMSRITGKPPKLWGSIVGFGKYHYKYASGHEGDTCLVGFSPRKAEFSIYLMGGYFPDTEVQSEALLSKLGKHKMGKACLYVKKLDDVDLDVLSDLIELSVTRLKQEYGELA